MQARGGGTCGGWFEVDDLKAVEANLEELGGTGEFRSLFSFFFESYTEYHKSDYMYL